MGKPDSWRQIHARLPPNSLRPANPLLPVTFTFDRAATSGARIVAIARAAAVSRSICPYTPPRVLHDYHIVDGSTVPPYLPSARRRQSRRARGAGRELRSPAARRGRAPRRGALHQRCLRGQYCPHQRSRCADFAAHHPGELRTRASDTGAGADRPPLLRARNSRLVPESLKSVRVPPIPLCDPDRRYRATRADLNRFRRLFSELINGETRAIISQPGRSDSVVDLDL